MAAFAQRLATLEAAILPQPDALAQQMMQWQAEGMTLRAIAARLNAEQVPTRSGRGQWYPSNLSRESFYGPNAGLTEVLVPAGYVTTVYDPVFVLTADATRYVPAPSRTPTRIPEPGLPFSLVFRCEPGKEDVILTIASAYEAASRRRVPPPAFTMSATNPSAGGRS